MLALVRFRGPCSASTGVALLIAGVSCTCDAADAGTPSAFRASCCSKKHQHGSAPSHKHHPDCQHCCQAAKLLTTPAKADLRAIVPLYFIVDVASFGPACVSYSHASTLLHSGASPPPLDLTCSLLI